MYDQVPETTLHKMLVPGAIILAGLLLAGAVYVYRVPIDWSFINGGPPPSTLATFDPPAANDHLFGNPGAPIKIIEYCDIDAPYCKQFQGVMDSLMATYGPSGQVAWIYRQFPIQDVDANSKENAVAAECAAQTGGNAAFFAFVDAVAKAAPGSKTFDTKSAPQVAGSVGVPGSYDDCISSKEQAAAVTTLYQKAVAAGATGAPYVILVTEGKSPNAIAGAFSYPAMKAVIDKARAAEGLN